MLKLQYSGHLMQRANTLEKILMLEKIDSKRRSGQQRMRQLASITNSMFMNLSKLWEMVEEKGDSHAGVLPVTKSDRTQRLKNNNQNHTWSAKPGFLCKGLHSNFPSRLRMFLTAS